jgi:glycosyltransferase involved in cell wall biosynthesis
MVGGMQGGRLMRVLVVARWYPSHDVPYRGAFVADLVEAMDRRGGVDQVVASWEPALVRGPDDTRADLLRQAEGAWRALVDHPAILNRPAGWGARGVPVARLRVLDDPARRSPGEVVERHAALLVPFALELARHRPIDLVHAHTGFPDGLAAATVAERLGIPLVVTEHASDVEKRLAADPSLAAAYRDLAISPGHRLIAVSAPFAARIAAVSGLDPERIDVVSNAVPIERFPLGPAAERDPNELLWVGARHEKKGTEVLLRAFARVHAARPATRLRLVGAASTIAMEQRWRSLATELGLAEAVSFEPTADREGVARAMARAAVFVHASPAEPFGVVAVEALATGLPVAATRSGGVEAILGPDGRFGDLADGTDAESLAAAVLRLLGRRTELDPAAMRRHVEDRFGARGVSLRISAIYEGLVSGGSLTATGTRTEAEDSLAVDERDTEAAPLVVALARPFLARRLAALGTIAPRGLTVVVALGRDDDEGHPAPTDVRIVEVDPDLDHRVAMKAAAGPSLPPLPGPPRRILRFVLAPRAALRRRRLLRERASMRRRTLQAAVLHAWEAHRDASPAASPWLVACDAEDVDAAATALAAGARLAPGGLRWLADRWSSPEASPPI